MKIIQINDAYDLYEPSWWEYLLGQRSYVKLNLQRARETGAFKDMLHKVKIDYDKG